MSIAKFHAEWLSLLEISGPFLSLPVLKKVFPQGLDPHDSDHFRVLRQVHEEWDAKIRGVDIQVRSDAPDGVESVRKYIPKPDARAQEIKKIVSDWLSKGKLKPSQIAILSPFEKNKSSLAETQKVGRMSLTTNPNEWRANAGVLLSTIKRFKGLEADAIIVTDVPNPETTPYFSTSDFYVGCSRAKHILVILAADEGVV